MKKALKMAALMLMAAVMMTACNKSDLPGFKKTDSGLHYKFVTENKGGQQVQKGDILVCEVVMKMDFT